MRAGDDKRTTWIAILLFDNVSPWLEGCRVPTLKQTPRSLPVAVDEVDPTTDSDHELVLDPTEGPEDDEVEALRFAIASYPADYKVKVLVQKWRDKQIVIPDFQRAYFWNQPQASKLIESFLIGLPVPQVFLYKDRLTQKLLVVDGHQRLSTIHQFYDEKFKDERIFRLTGVHRRWEGKTYSDLAQPDRFRLDDSSMRAIVLQQLSPDDQDSVYLIFERLNAGAVKLNPMEIRRTVFHGPAVKLIERLNRDTNWRTLIGLARPEPRLRDAELVLRVLALGAGWRDYTKPMKAYLTDYMKILRRSRDDERAILEIRFKTATAVVAEALGERPFHLRGPLNVGALDATLGAVLEVGSTDPRVVESCYSTLLADPTFIRNVQFNTSDVQVVKSRFQAILDSLKPKG